MSQSSITVVIPAKNVAAFVHRQLEALDTQSMLDFDVVVSNNGSSDQTRSVVEAWKPAFRSLRCIDASGRPGVAYARNQGIAASSSELILICDSDDVVSPTWVAAHQQALRVSDASTGPLVLTEKGHEGFGVWVEDEVPIASGYLPYMPGCNMGFHRNAFDAVGGFDPNLWRGQEDVDFGWRLSLAGFQISHAPDAIVRYEQRVGLTPKLRQQFKYGRAFADLYARYHESPLVVQSLKWRLRWWQSFVTQRLRTPFDAKATLAPIAFQAGRIVGSVAHRRRTPMW